MIETNPCNDCLVQAICTEICDQKETYTEFIVNELCDICKHIYDDDGLRILMVPENVEEAHRKVVAECEKNSDECQAILDRYIKYGVVRKF